jgi:hypothetical protein
MLASAVAVMIAQNLILMPGSDVASLCTDIARNFLVTVRHATTRGMEDKSVRPSQSDSGSTKKAVQSPAEPLAISETRFVKIQSFLQLNLESEQPWTTPTPPNRVIRCK